MTRTASLTAVIEREKDGFVSLCPELDIASQGNTVEESLANLREAVELFLDRKIRLPDIARLVERVLEQHRSMLHPGLEDILAADDWARKTVKQLVGEGSW